MNPMKILVQVALTAVCCAGPALSHAAKCNGTNINNVVSWEPTEISKGTTLTTLRVTSVIVSDDPNSPYHLLAGECVGSLLTTADGKTQGGGSCARKDKDGDVFNEEWVVTSADGSKGTAKFVGGTGKFARTTGTGQWEVTPLQGKTAAVRWVGNCQ